MARLEKQLPEPGAILFALLNFLAKIGFNRADGASWKTKRRLCMKMRWGFAATLLTVAISVPAAWAQVSRPVPPSTNSTATGRQQPCWQQAGVSRSALQQRRQVAEIMHQQIESVCANTSLTAQQRHQQIQQIREQAQSRMNGLVSQSQMESIRSCRAQRGHSAGIPHGSGMGPCGEMPTHGSIGTSPTANPKQAMEPDEPVE